MKLKTIQVRVGEWKLGEGAVRFRSYGLGSCVALVLWEPEKKIGGMAHILLPGTNSQIPPHPGAKFAPSAVRNLVNEMKKMGAHPQKLVAKLVGGANMFPKKFNPEQEFMGKNIGERNLLAVRKSLNELKIPILAEEVGGEKGRTIEFYPQTGKVLIYKSNGEVKEI